MEPPTIELKPLTQDAEDIDGISDDGSEDSGTLSYDNLLGKSEATLDTGTKLRIAAIMLCFLAQGMNDTGIGALLLKIEGHYGLTDGAMSLIFPTVVLGYICGTSLLLSVLHRYGWRGIAWVAPILHITAAATISSAPPIMVVILGYFCSGLGSGFSDAGFCAYASKLPYANVVQGLMQGSYSIGAILGPIACTAVLQQNLEWYVFYWLMIFVTSSEMLSLTLAFRTQDVKKYRLEHDVSETQEKKGLHRAKLVWMCGIFYFFYLSIECSYTNWMAAYMTRIREVEEATAALSSSMFWVGVTVGRFLLGPVTQYFGSDLSVTVYIVLATFFEVLLQFNNHFGVSLVLLGLTGFFFAPMYPSGIVMLAAKLPVHEYVGGIAVAASMGMIGGAGAQILVGFWAEKFGLAYLIEMLLFASVLVLVAWAFFAKTK